LELLPGKRKQLGKKNLEEGRTGKSARSNAGSDAVEPSPIVNQKQHTISNGKPVVVRISGEGGGRSLKEEGKKRDLGWRGCPEGGFSGEKKTV